MSRHGSSGLTLGPNKQSPIRRRPNLPGAPRTSPGQRLGDRRQIPPGLEPFVGAAGRTPIGGANRGTPQQRAAQQRNAQITPSSFGPTLPPVGPGQLPIGPEAASFDPNRAFGRDAGPPVPGFLGAAGRNAISPGQGGPGAPAPPGRSEQQQRVFDTGALAQSQGRLFQNSILPPLPFQSFDDFFRANALGRQLRNFNNNPPPPGGGNRFTPDQARIRAAGGDPGSSTFVSGPGQQPTGQVPGGGQLPGAGAPVPPQSAAPPGFGSGGSQREDVGGGAGAGLNVGLIENQAIFAALREQFMRALIPQLVGGL